MSIAYESIGFGILDPRSTLPSMYLVYLNTYYLQHLSSIYSILTPHCNFIDVSNTLNLTTTHTYFIMFSSHELTKTTPHTHTHFINL